MVPTAQRWLRKGKSWWWRRLRRGRVPHAVVLMYHRVAAVPRVDPWRLCVEPGNFDAQLGALRRFADILPLERLPETMRTRREGRPVVAITFDDGYLDNLRAAKPILERHEAPATVFLATGCIERGDRYWWDRLLDVVHAPEELPRELRIEGPNGPFEWHADQAANNADAARSVRKGLVDALWSWLVRLQEDERLTALSGLEQWVGRPRPLDPDARPMSPSQVAELLRGGLVRTGAHTATHARLPQLDREQAMSEIRRSRSDCERLAGVEPSCFAYPFGAYDEQTVDCVRDAGFRLAVTSDGGLAWADRDRLALPRIAVGNWSGPRLARYLRHYWLA